MNWTEDHPVSAVRWVPVEDVSANDYNPNSVAPPEMELLRHSIESDGYTQPIVTWDTGSGLEVVDGFHRYKVGVAIGLTHLPVVVVNRNRTERGDRISSTIRHNRARGKHQIGAMSDIIQELSKRNWSDKKIGRELGMDPDEVLRLKQISGLAELFGDREFSEAWEAE
jgi:ParB-like chromosome segregation protein Spo0J